MSFYYSPEDNGLEKIAEIDFSDGNYQFDIRCVWREVATGRLLTARDSGCSCPAPFEDYRSIDQLDVVNLDEIEAEGKRDHSHASLDDRESFLRAIREAQR